MNDYNPLTRLNSPGTWEIQPRMIRITSPAAPGLSRYIEDLYISSPSTANTAIPVRPAAARRLMSMSDDLVSVVSSNDRSLPWSEALSLLVDRRVDDEPWDTSQRR